MIYIDIIAAENPEIFEFCYNYLLDWSYTQNYFIYFYISYLPSCMYIFYLLDVTHKLNTVI